MLRTLEYIQNKKHITLPCTIEQVSQAQRNIIVNYILKHGFTVINNSINNEDCVIIHLGKDKVYSYCTGISCCSDNGRCTELIRPCDVEKKLVYINIQSVDRVIQTINNSKDKCIFR